MPASRNPGTPLFALHSPYLSIKARKNTKNFNTTETSFNKNSLFNISLYKLKATTAEMTVCMMVQLTYCSQKFTKNITPPWVTSKTLCLEVN